jgi:DNA-binding XRE family transcriptional regulator
MKITVRKYKTTRDFGLALGLTDLDMKLIQQKKKLIEKLRKARIRQHLSQAQLAALVSSKQPAIARMESGQVAEVSMDFLLKVTFVLKVPISIPSLKDAA